MTEGYMNEHREEQGVSINLFTDLKFLALQYEETFVLGDNTFETLWHALEVNKYLYTDSLNVEGRKFVLVRYIMGLQYDKAVQEVRGLSITNKDYYANREHILKQAVVARLKSNKAYMKAFLDTGKQRLYYANPLDSEWGGRNNRYGFLLETLRKELSQEQY